MSIIQRTAASLARCVKDYSQFRGSAAVFDDTMMWHVEVGYVINRLLKFAHVS